MKKILSIGELLIDFNTLENNDFGYPVLSAAPGGAPANYLASAVKFGAECEMLCKVGNDFFGKKLKETLEECNIGTNGVIIDDNSFTTLAFVTHNKHGNRDFSFARKPGADTQLKKEEIDLRLIDSCDLFHFGSLSFTHEPSAETTEYCIKYAEEKGKIISYDPNYRAPLWKSETEAKEKIKQGFRYADIVKISDEEGLFLFGADEKNTAEALIKEYGCTLVFVTMGKKGCYFSNGKHNGFVENYNDVKTVDTTGAGDIFGGCADTLVLETNKNPAELTKTELIKICKTALCCASLSTEIFGGIYSVPDKETVTKKSGISNRE